MKWKIHGNGFLRIYITDDIWLHFYANWIPRQKVPTLIHDHDFLLKSKILFGAIIQNLYTSHWNVNDGRFYVCVPTSWGGLTAYELDNDTSKPFRTDLIWRSRQSFSRGMSYSLAAGKIHRIDLQSRFAITLVNRQIVENRGKQRVFVPVPSEPDNKFDNKTHTGFWKLVWRLLQHQPFLGGYYEHP